MVEANPLHTPQTWWPARGPEARWMAKRTREKEPAPGSVGAVVRQLRQERGWSQVELARRADIGQNDVSRVETGKSKIPQEQTLVAIAEALGVSLGLIYERTLYPEISYQIPPLRHELKTMRVNQQTVMTHLARFMKEHEAALGDRDPAETVAHLLTPPPVKNGTPVA
jgi:HTH-type transcriptional regulator/antitoxin HipB